MEILVRVDGGVGWKDEYAMGWCGLLAKGCTECTPDGARHTRTRIGAFHSTPPSEHKTQFRAPDHHGLRLLHFINGFCDFT
jgi:hypothetical protein